MPVDPATLDERELVMRALRQETEAFSLLVTRHAAMVYSLAFRMVGEKAEAEDLAQETFVAAYRALSSFRLDSKFSTWLYRIATNKCKDWLRARRPTVSIAEETDEEDGSPAHQLVEPTTPEGMLSQQQMGQHLETAIQALPVLYREAFLLKHVEGLSYEEMSAIVGVNADTLKMRVYKARTKLCTTLQHLRDDL